MKQITLIKRLAEYDRFSGRHVYTSSDLASICHEDTLRALQATLARLVRAGVLQRAAKDVYVFGLSVHRGSGHTIEHIANDLRRGHHNYVSLESALSEYGVIAQVPIDQTTVMTTGRRGVYKTPYGVIEFTHTGLSDVDIRDSVKYVGRPLNLATCRAAVRDLRKVGRNTHLINEEEIQDEEISENELRRGHLYLPRTAIRQVPFVIF